MGGQRDARSISVISFLRRYNEIVTVTPASLELSRIWKRVLLLQNRKSICELKQALETLRE